MVTCGSFGYKIGRKIRLTHVHCDADMLWQTCVREIFVLMKHYGSIDLLRDEFNKLQDAKNNPTLEAIEKCKPYTNLNISYKTTKDWYCLTYNCQHSFINILDTGYFLNNGLKPGLILLLDFNTNSIRFYYVNNDKTEKEYEKATIDEIMEFDDMPTKSMTEILTETKEYAKQHNEKIDLINAEIKNLNQLINNAIKIGATQDILQQASTLKKNMEDDRKKLEYDYDYFYHRLDALNLINHDV